MSVSKRKTIDPGLPIRMRRKGDVYYYVPTIDGRQRWIRLSASFAEAIAKWSEYEGRALEGSTVSDALDRYILEVLPTKAKTTQREYLRYSTQLRKVFGDSRLDMVKQHHVAQYLDRRSSKYEANREVAMLSSVFASAQRWGWCDTNPCHGIRRNPEKKRTRHLYDGEISAVRAAAGPQIQCIMDLVLMTALRKSDVLRIRLSDFKKEGLRVTIQKTGNELIFERTPALEALWARCKRLRRRIGTLYLFANRKGQPYTTGGFDSIWQRTLKRAGVQDFRFHDLRARALTDAEKRYGLEYARTLAAHMNITTTERYVRDRQSKIVRPLE